MKKFIIGVITYFIFIILYFIQSNFFGWFTIAEISPNIFVIYILFLGLFTNNKFSLIMALLTGVTLDLVIGKTLGATAVLFLLIAMIANYFDKNFSKDNKLTIIIMTIGMTIVFEVANYFLNVLILEIPIEIESFSKILLIEVLYNAILIFIFYNSFIKLGTTLERQFKEKNILTRYF